ncbi:MAG: anaerobic glycerol-3-phosphate dehydrogenase subunit A [Thermodesulfobacteriota bacterium]|nr:anaerobic glycerol-3-phosphate dehydrogenase subunit A [Thermodesulfobacteriota bacterium]
MKTVETDVIIIGGGATGTGIARDCSLRGIACVLIEKNDLASGTTGRNHGLLHSGARYAVKDPASARECIAENKILKKIARHCIEDTGGLFATLPEDDPHYHDELMDACKSTGIRTRDISPEQAISIEPNLNPDVLRALTVPDATIDPFRLASANVLDAAERGARIFTHSEVTGILMTQSAVEGVTCVDRNTGEPFSVYGKLLINASGVWGQMICNMAGISLTMFPSKGSMVILDYRINNVVINRSREPADGDILVPGDTVSLIGTTSRKIPYEAIHDLSVSREEIRTLLADGEKLVPNLSRTRVLRAFSGVRPLVAASKETRGRDITRGIVLIDHKERDSMDNFITIAGGKLMTYRLMAEKATDLACRKLGLNIACSTQEVPLPGSEKPPRTAKQPPCFSESVASSTYYRHGERARAILAAPPGKTALMCECEMVTEKEVAYALRNLHVRDIVDLRRRTRIGMGPCQGLLCAYRCAGAFIDYKSTPGSSATKMLIDFLMERWKGVRPVLWGDTLREAEFAYWICEGIFGLGKIVDRSEGKGQGVSVADEF